jgi:hypothetical protein
LFFYILQRSFRNVKVFEGTIEFFHDVLQINVTAANPRTPKRTYDVSRGQNRYGMRGFPIKNKKKEQFSISIQDESGV